MQEREQKRKLSLLDDDKQEIAQPKSMTLPVPDKTELRSRIKTAMNNYTNSRYRDFHKALGDIKKHVNYLCHADDHDVNSTTNITKYGQNPYVNYTHEERTKKLVHCAIRFEDMMKGMEG